MFVVDFAYSDVTCAVITEDIDLFASCRFITHFIYCYLCSTFSILNKFLVKIKLYGILSLSHIFHVIIFYNSTMYLQTLCENP